MIKFCNNGLLFLCILIALLSPSDSVRFTMEPPRDITVKYGQSVWLNWNHVLENGETLAENIVHFKSSLTGITVKIASKIRLTPNSSFPKVKTYSSNFSVAIINVDYTYSGIYSFEVRTSPLKVKKSNKVSLKVKDPVWVIQHQPRIVSIVKGSDIRFSWKYYFHGVTVINQVCKFISEERDEVYTIAEGNPLKASPNFPKIVTYPKNRLFAIINAGLRERGTYFCEYLYNVNNDSIGLFESSKTFLMVQGRSSRGSPIQKITMYGIVIAVILLSKSFTC